MNIEQMLNEIHLENFSKQSSGKLGTTTNVQRAIRILSSIPKGDLEVEGKKNPQVALAVYILYKYVQNTWKKNNPSSKKTLKTSKGIKEKKSEEELAAEQEAKDKAVVEADETAEKENNPEENSALFAQAKNVLSKALGFSNISSLDNFTSHSQPYLDLAIPIVNQISSGKLPPYVVPAKKITPQKSTEEPEKEPVEEPTPVEKPTEEEPTTEKSAAPESTKVAPADDTTTPETEQKLSNLANPNATLADFQKNSEELMNTIKQKKEELLSSVGKEGRDRSGDKLLSSQFDKANRLYKKIAQEENYSKNGKPTTRARMALADLQHIANTIETRHHLKTSDNTAQIYGKQALNTIKKIGTIPSKLGKTAEGIKNRLANTRVGIDLQDTVRRSKEKSTQDAIRQIGERMGPEAAKKFEEISATPLNKRTEEQRDFYDNALKNVDDNPVKKLAGKVVDTVIDKVGSKSEPAVASKEPLVGKVATPEIGPGTSSPALSAYKGVANTGKTPKKIMTQAEINNKKTQGLKRTIAKAVTPQPADAGTTVAPQQSLTPKEGDTSADGKQVFTGGKWINKFIPQQNPAAELRKAAMSVNTEKPEEDDKKLEKKIRSIVVSELKKRAK